LLIFQGFSLANKTDKTLPEFIGTQPDRMMHFASSIQAINLVQGYAPDLLSQDYDWESLGNVSVVHVGGGRGQVNTELAKTFLDTKLVVQDMGMIIEGAEAEIPESLKGRVEFMNHELFDTQTVQADVYFFHIVFCN
jgi:hypothetical protein